jgi:hypothetical protein
MTVARSFSAGSSGVIGGARRHVEALRAGLLAGASPDIAREPFDPRRFS